MAINLSKGDNVSFSHSLTNVCVGLGWDPNEGAGHEYDLDASAFMLGHNGRLITDEFFVFYNDQTGRNSEEGDDETLMVDLAKVDPRVQEILFTATIYKAEERRQNFGQVSNAYIRIYNSTNEEEIARYDLNEDFSVETAVEFGRLYRSFGEWKFEALGIGRKGGLQALVDKYK